MFDGRHASVERGLIPGGGFMLTPEFKAELDTAFTPLPSTIAHRQARDAAVKVHDWPAYWQTFIDESRDRQDRLTADLSSDCLAR